MSNRFDDKVASVSKALTILEELGKEPGGMGLIDISNKVGMNKTTVYRLLTSLLEKEFVEQMEDTGKYSLGLKILGIASSLYEKLDVRTILRKYVAQLLETFQGTILITRKLDQDYIILDLICSDKECNLNINTGEKLPSGSAVQKTFLANMSLWQPGRRVFTETLKEKEAHLNKELKQIALQGYAEVSEDIGELPALAVPIFNFSKNVVYVVSLHSSHLKDKKLQSKLILNLLELANQISCDLGFVNYI